MFPASDFFSAIVSRVGGRRRHGILLSSNVLFWSKRPETNTVSAGRSLATRFTKAGQDEARERRDAPAHITNGEECLSSDD